MFVRDTPLVCWPLIASPVLLSECRAAHLHGVQCPHPFFLGAFMERQLLAVIQGGFPFLSLGWVPESTSQATGIVQLLWKAEGSSKQDSSISRGSLAPLVWDWGTGQEGTEGFLGNWGWESGR